MGGMLWNVVGTRRWGIVARCGGDSGRWNSVANKLDKNNNYLPTVDSKRREEGKEGASDSTFTTAPNRQHVQSSTLLLASSPWALLEHRMHRMLNPRRTHKAKHSLE